MATAVILLVVSSFFTAKSAETMYHPAICNESSPETTPEPHTPEPPTVDMILGKWIVLKQDKDTEQMNCPTVVLKVTDNDTMIEATFSTVDNSSKKEVSESVIVTLRENNTVFLLETSKEYYFLNTIDTEANYTIIFTCRGNKPVRFIAARSLNVEVEGDDLQDVKLDCSSAFTFVQQSMITMMLIVFPSMFLI